MKCCPRCREEKPHDQFNRDKKRKDGYQVYCRECGNAITRAYYQRNSEKVIARSGKWAKEHPEVGRAKSRAWRAANMDKVRERKQRDYAENGEAIRALLRDNGFRRKFGISLAERDELAEGQDNRCSICGTHESDLSKRLAVDHDHATGAVRAMLCQNCNLGIGYFIDNPELLEKAAEYVRHHTNRTLSEAVESDGA